jgi:hypothetical protein
VLEAALAAQGLLTQSPETRAAVRTIREAVQAKPTARAEAYHALFMWARRRFYFEKRFANAAPARLPPKRSARTSAVRALPVIG